MIPTPLEPPIDANNVEVANPKDTTVELECQDILVQVECPKDTTTEVYLQLPLSVKKPLCEANAK